MSMLLPGSPSPMMAVLAAGDPLNELGIILASYRNRAVANARWSRTMGASTTRKTGTYSFWVERANLTARNTFVSNDNGTDYGCAEFDTSSRFSFGDSAAAGTYTTTTLYRDPPQFMHVVIGLDSTNAVAADRIKVEINGVRDTTGSLSIGLNVDFYMFQAASFQLGAFTRVGAYFDGLIAQFSYVDGKQLPASAFAQTHPLTKQWRPKAKAAIRSAVAVGGGARNGWGANGALWPFDDATSLTTLGYDRSQSDTDTTGNNLTANNISLTVGVTYDSLVSTPTDCFATLNPLANGGMTIEAANLRCSKVSGDSFCPATFKITQPAYCEFTVSAGGGNLAGFSAEGQASGYPGWVPNSYGLYQSGQLFSNGSTIATLTAYTISDVMMLARDPVSGKIWFGKNGTWMGSGNPATGANPAATNTAPMFFAGGSSGGADQQFNFGQRPFLYAVPAGFNVQSTKNLPKPTGAALKPWEHCFVTTVAKSGDTNFTLPWDASLYDTLFEIKRRDAAGQWYQVDGLRGYNKILSSSNTSVEGTDANVIGVVGTTATLKSTLADGQYDVICWKAGLVSARQTNTTGSITTTVSANVLAGFSIATYTGTAANATIGHGLGAAVARMDYYRRSAGGVSHPMWHKSFGAAGNSDYVYIELTGGKGAYGAANFWNGTMPSSSVASIGTDASVNASTVTYVAYFRAEVPGYSKFDSYAATGNADGPNLFTEGTPVLFLPKRTDSSGDHHVFNGAAYPGNPVSGNLAMSSSVGIGTFANTNTADFAAGSVKIRHDGATGYNNYSGATYIYTAINAASLRYSTAH